MIRAMEVVSMIPSGRLSDLKQIQIKKIYKRQHSTMILPAALMIDPDSKALRILNLPKMMVNEIMKTEKTQIGRPIA